MVAPGLGFLSPCVKVRGTGRLVGPDLSVTRSVIDDSAGRARNQLGLRQVVRVVP